MRDGSRFHLPDLRSRRTWTGWNGSSAGLALALTARDRVAQTVVVCPREDEVARIVEDTRFFLRLLGLESTVRLLTFPARPSDIRPALVPEPSNGMKRVAALYELLERGDPLFVFASFQALAQRTLSWETLAESTARWTVGAEREEVVRKLTDLGYAREALVEEPGHVSVRGGIVDFFPPHAPAPFRLEFFGESLESIRTFDPATQRSAGTAEYAVAIPCHEILLNGQTSETVLSRLKELADTRDLPRIARGELEEMIENHRYNPVLEQLLDLFPGTNGSLADYLAPEARWIGLDPFLRAREREELKEQFGRIEGEMERDRRLVSAPASLSLPLDEVAAKMAERTTLDISDIALEEEKERTSPFEIHPLNELRRSLLEYRRKDSPLEPLVHLLSEWRDRGVSVLFAAPTASEAHRLAELLSRAAPQIRVLDEIPPDLFDRAAAAPQIVVGHLSSGFLFPAERLAIVTDQEIFGERKQTIVREISRENFFASLSEIREGNAVVHIDHGIGIFRGLKRITAGGIQNDFLLLEYADGDKIYLPIYRLDRIHRYVGGDSDAPKVSKLGSPAVWERARQKAKKAVEEMAQELIALYAARKVAKASSLSHPDNHYLAFEARFPFEETRDQLKAIESVGSDLESERPMDRLICGDVGFGKTEVALRAAFRVAMEGKQVAVLVPTTILALQHYETFRERLKEDPIRIDYLSRFKSPQEQRDVLSQLKEGKLDIVIGTHRLLSKDVVFRELGLLIVDEEHRFGVKHKERIKQFRTNVHVLTLTATPIPRTLQMSVAGIRDLSVINTPPLDRKSIQTYLCRFEDAVIQGAIRKELERKGQVFFVHNRVETIGGMAQHLARLVPEARVEIGHGQMAERDLERTMLRFARHEFDVLLCTTIIESGLDFPLANTILLNRADTFGLAQLYQLRGRVGRSARSAYAYLLIPGEELVSRDAIERLKVLKRFTELGSGLKIALHDLEIRGAGNLLGPSQSGHIAAIGFELYTDLLDKAVKRLKGERVEEEVEPEIHSSLPAFFPEDYVGDAGERLVLYKRLSSVKSPEDLEGMRRELLDRFGALPPTAENLLRVIELKVLARRLGIARLKLTDDSPSLEFTDRAASHLERILALVRKDRRLVLRPNGELQVRLPPRSDGVEETKKILLGLNES